MDLQNKNTVITGASSGIGAALAWEFAESGSHLTLLARRKDRLENIQSNLQSSYPNQKFIICVTDVTSDESVKLAIEQSLKEFGKIDTVIANAGFGVTGGVMDLSLEDYRRQFETNLYGVLRTVKQTVPFLKLTRGRLAIIGSVNGFIALPNNSAYAMSKYSIRALSDSLFYELKPLGISVTHIAPGFITSEIRRVNNFGVYKEKSQDPIPAWLQMDSKTAAKKISRAIYVRRKERVVTGHGWWIVTLSRLLPQFVSLLIGFFGIKARSEPKS